MHAKTRKIVPLALTATAALLLFSPAYILLALNSVLGLGFAEAYAASLAAFASGLILAYLALNLKERLGS